MQSLDAKTARKLLTTLSRQTTFALGALPEAQALLPHLFDPAARGRLLAHALAEALHEVDADLDQRYGVQRFTTCRFLKGERVRALGEMSALSRSSVNRLISDALEHVAQQLPALLHQPTPPAMWMTYAGAHPIAADLAAWERAGWNIVWAHKNTNADDPNDELLAAVHTQLAEIGALTTLQPDPWCCFTQQYVVVSTGLAALPVILALDEVEPDNEVFNALDDKGEKCGIVAAQAISFQMSETRSAES
jgi:hypothetical protein